MSYRKLERIIFIEHEGELNVSDCVFCALPSTTKQCYSRKLYERRRILHENLAALSSPKKPFHTGVDCFTLNTTKAKSWKEASICNSWQCSEECKAAGE